MHIVVKYLSEIIIICSVYTIFFGFIFGECFGDFFEKIGLLHPVKTTLGGLEIEWNRMHSLLPLLVLSIMIGVFHVTLGFLLKLLQAIKHKHRHEVIEVILILVSLGSIFLSIGSMSGMIAREMLWPVLMILLGSVAGLMYMKGPLMAMELLSFVGNMLSYARLMAVGVASAYLAFVGNMLGSLLGNVFFGVIVAVLFHIINMCLAFSPAIQSARLHYVEFFSKFYESGKISYQPLSRRQA